MLLLTRNKGQKIHIGNNIVLGICGVQGNHVRIGIEAPKGVNIVRSEIAHKFDKNGKRAEK